MPVSNYTPVTPGPGLTEGKQLAADAIVRLNRELNNPITANIESCALSVYNLFRYGEMIIIDSGTNPHA